MSKLEMNEFMSSNEIIGLFIGNVYRACNNSQITVTLYFFKRTVIYKMSKALFVRLLILICGIICIQCKLSSIENRYKKGVLAYSGERWTECIKQFEETLHLYKLYKSIIVNCRQKCKSQTYESQLKENIDDFKAYEKFFNIRNCLNNCHEKSFTDMEVDSDLNEKILFNLQARRPYEYLHICYFQVNLIPKAASAAYTFLVTHPDHEDMKNNLKFYIQQPEVEAKEVVDYEGDDYTVLFKHGLIAYQQNNWAETVASMEEVLTDYMSSENVCRAECERQPEQQTSSEIFVTISNDIASLLHCQQHCQDKLKNLDYNSGVEFIADVLNYLQISYYHLDRFADAAQAVASYLVLMPADEDMLENKKIYSSLTDEKSFSARPTTNHYFYRDNYEKKLIQLFHQGNDDYNIKTNEV